MLPGHQDLCIPGAARSESVCQNFAGFNISDDNFSPAHRGPYKLGIFCFYPDDNVSGF